MSFKVKTIDPPAGIVAVGGVAVERADWDEPGRKPKMKNPGGGGGCGFWLCHPDGATGPITEACEVSCCASEPTGILIVSHCRVTAAAVSFDATSVSVALVTPACSGKGSVMIV